MYFFRAPPVRVEDGRVTEDGNERDDLVPACVPIATADPLITDRDPIVDQSEFMVVPHLCRRVSTPPRLGGDGFEKLQGFYPLLT